MDLFPIAKEKGITIITQAEFPQLVMLFSLGYMIIWVLLFLMHKRALQLSKQLALNNYEIRFTKHEIRGAVLNAVIGFSAILFAAMGYPLLAGICYLFIPVVLILNRWGFKREIKKRVIK